MNKKNKPMETVQSRYFLFIYLFIFIYTTQNLLRITFLTSCQRSPSRSIFQFLAHLCWTFIHAFNLNVSLFFIFPGFQNMCQSTDTPKICRNKNPGGWA